MDILESFKNTVPEYHGTTTLITIEKQIVYPITSLFYLF